MRLTAVLSCAAAAAAAPAPAPAREPSKTAPCDSPLIAGQVPVTIDGGTSLWSIAVAGDAVSGVSITGGAMTMQHNDRGYLVNIGDACPTAFSADLYDNRLKLLGRQLNYTVDLASVGCACNAALYMVSMPAINASQQPDPTKNGDFYCDANDVEGFWCPEVDLMEANTAAMQVTPHRCAAPTGSWYPSCDRSGCGLNTYRNCGPKCYGPGSGYTIDTTQPFTVSHSFPTDGAGTLVGMVTQLHQPGSPGVVLLNHTDAGCGADYLEDMTVALANGMVITFSVWGSDGATMKWLDVPPCSLATACNLDSALTVSGISVGLLPGAGGA